MNFRVLLLLFLSFLSVEIKAQSETPNPITTAVPFLLISPDSRAGALGDAGVANSPDASSIYWNPGQIAKSDKDFEICVNYSPWLRNLIDDMGLFNASMSKKINENSGFALAFTYFDQGLIEFTDIYGNSIGDSQSRDFSLTGGYSLKISPDWAIGANLKYISSNLTGNLNVFGSPSKTGKTVAGELGVYYDQEHRGSVKPANWAFGLMLQNIGGKLNYGFGESFIPANLKLGTKFSYKGDDFNKFSVLLDFNKLLVPTPNPSDTTNSVNSESAINGIFASFSDAPGGFKEELQEWTVNTGAEYDYNDIFKARVGFHYLSPMKGNLKYFTTGIGVMLQQKFGLDLAYLIPTGGSNNALANTWRISLIFQIDQKGRIKGSNQRI